MMSYDSQIQIVKPYEPVSRLGVKFYYLDSNDKHVISQAVKAKLFQYSLQS